MSVKYDMIIHEKGFHKDHWSFKILEGKYEGVIYQYDTVKFEEKEENDKDVGFLHFNTLMVENPYDDSIIDDEDFKQTVGDILVEQIKIGFEEYDDTSRTNDTEESAK